MSSGIFRHCCRLRRFSPGYGFYEIGSFGDWLLFTRLEREEWTLAFSVLALVVHPVLTVWSKNSLIGPYSSYSFWAIGSRAC